MKVIYDNTAHFTGVNPVKKMVPQRPKESRGDLNPIPVEKTGHSAADVARYPRLPTPGTSGQVGIGRTNTLRSTKRAMKSE